MIPKGQFERHSSKVSSMAFSHDCRQIASGSLDSTAKVWDAGSGACLKTLDGHSGIIRSIAFSHDGQVATGSHDKTVKIWNVCSGVCLKTLEGHKYFVSSVAFSSASSQQQLVASGSLEGIVKIWDAGSGSCLQTLPHAMSINSLAFSQDGQQVISRSSNKTAKIWDVSSGACLKTLDGHDGGVVSAAFSDDGQLVATATHNGVVRLWDASGVCIQTLAANHSMSYDIAGLYAKTPLSQYQGYALSADKKWITWKGQNVLWVPQEYRPTALCSRAGAHTVAFGCSGGRALIFNFSTTKPLSL